MSSKERDVPPPRVSSPSCSGLAFPEYTTGWRRSLYAATTWTDLSANWSNTRGGLAFVKSDMDTSTYRGIYIYIASQVPHHRHPHVTEGASKGTGASSNWLSPFFSSSHCNSGAFQKQSACSCVNRYHHIKHTLILPLAIEIAAITQTRLSPDDQSWARVF